MDLDVGIWVWGGGGGVVWVLLLFSGCCWVGIIFDWLSILFVSGLFVLYCIMIFIVWSILLL